MEMFDKIFVINLSDQIGINRLLRIGRHFQEQGIMFERWEGTANSIGHIGLLWTYMRLLNHCVKNQWSNVLIFEDDAMCEISARSFINHIWPQVPFNYDCLFFGVNLQSRPVRYSENLLQIKSAYASHAIAYSLTAMKKIIQLIKENPFDPYDCVLNKFLIPDGKCYCTYPQLFFQRAGVSHIQKDFKDWKAVSAQSFSMYTKDI